jgi:hypothetical protein
LEGDSFNPNLLPTVNPVHTLHRVFSPLAVPEALRLAPALPAADAAVPSALIAKLNTTIDADGECLEKICKDLHANLVLENKHGRYWYGWGGTAQPEHFGMELPITPSQMRWVNMVRAIGLGLMPVFEPREAGLMARPLRATGNISASAWYRIMLVGFVSFIIVEIVKLVESWLLRRPAATGPVGRG